MIHPSHEEFLRAQAATMSVEAFMSDHGEEADRDLRIGWIVALLFFGAFLGWASFVRLDAAATASGVVVVSGNRQTVQHRDGGTVSALRVQEGQHVRQGQVLVELAPAETLALERSLSAQVTGLRAERARLFAERADQPTIERPVEFASLLGEDAAEADKAMRLQQATLTARRAALANQKAVLRQQSAQLNEKIGGLARQITTSSHQDRLFGEELEGLKPLTVQGYVSKNRLRELERQRAAMAGSIAGLAASQAATRQEIGETRVQAIGLDAQRMQEVAQDLRTTEASLADILPRLEAASEQLNRMRIRAPAAGQVVGLSIFTVGGVISPGQKLMDIVPDARPLVVEVRLAPRDAAEAHVGQAAQVRLSAVNERDVPMLSGTISKLSADSFQDEHTGVRFFTAEVTVSGDALERLAKTSAGVGALKAGVPVDVMIPLRPRTMLSYLLDPLRQSFWRSLREQ